jgi:hypothetical protein
MIPENQVILNYIMRHTGIWISAGMKELRPASESVNGALSLTIAQSEQSPEAYERLIRAASEYVDDEVRAPEWISARYLLPLVCRLAWAVLNADHQVRQTLRADLVASLEKTQHPIGVARELSVTALIANSGTAAADHVAIVIMASPESEKQVEIVGAEGVVDRVPPGRTAHHTVALRLASGCPVLALDYLLTWTDPSSKDRSSVGTLKLTAQREVDWDSARVNPYSLRSISEAARLYGRDDILDRLKSGVMGMQSFYLTGQKRVGKSSVARVLHAGFGNRPPYVPVYVTLGELSLGSAGALIHSLEEMVAEHAPGGLASPLAAAVASEYEFRADMARSSRASLRALDQCDPAIRVVCVIDDFDELDDALYKGPEATALFLYLRTLIDRGSWSFVLVGSERLPEILRYQGERLNQVKRVSLDYLDDAASVGQLVRLPATPFLDFSDEAVTEVSWWSAGNPYYATHICMRLYENMVARRDHYVGVADVRGAIGSLAQEESVSTFQHFWKDGVFELGGSAERFQQLNALMLIAVAECEGYERKGVERETVLRSESLAKHDPYQVRYRLDNLIERGVLQEVEQRIRIRVPLLSRWLQGIGAAAVRASFGERDLDVVLALPRPAVGERAIVELAKDLVYRESAVNEVRLQAWLGQFGDEKAQGLALRLLTRLKDKGYYDQARIYMLFRRLHSLVVAEQATGGDWAQIVKRGKTTNVYVTFVDREGKSGAALAYAYRVTNQLSATLAGSIDDAVAFLRQTSKPSILVFVDDFIGSGKTVVQTLGGFQVRWAAEGFGSKGHSCYCVALAGLASGIDYVRAEAEGVCRVLVADELQAESRAFAPNAGIFESDEDRVEAERMCRAIGEVLEPKHPLGFDDGQALVVFAHRCPNNTLPVFYKEGRSYQGRNWLPLFPR